MKKLGLMATLVALVTIIGPEGKKQTHAFGDGQPDAKSISKSIKKALQGAGKKLPELHAAAEEELAEEDNVTVSINASSVSINGQKLKFKRASERTFDKLLDSKASKQRTSSCFVYLWDDAGLRVYGAWGFQRGIDWCDFILQKTNDKDEIVPKSAFSGKLTVNGVSVTANMTQTELVKALGHQLKPLPGHSFRLSLKKHDVVFYFGGGKTNALQSVAIRRKSAVGRLIHFSE